MSILVLAACVLPAAADRPDYQDVLHSCGPLALHVCAELNQRDVSQEAISTLVPTQNGTCTLLELNDAAHHFGLRTLALQWSEERLPDCAIPAIVPVSPPDQGPHFVVAARMADDHVQLIDYPQAPAWISHQALREHLGWDGTALHVARDAQQLSELRDKATGRRLGPLFFWTILAIALISTWSLARRRGALSPSA